MQAKLAVPLLAGLAAGSALAQSSVTLFGIVDAGVRHVSNSGAGNRATLAQGGLNPSRIGVRGTEDLGGGMALKFWLEGGFSPDTGAAGASGTGLDFTRESHLTLATPYGDLRLGRDYSATFWNTTWPFEPFGNNGIGASVGVARFNGGSNLAGGGALQQPSTLRVSNSISYILPKLNGLYGQLQYALSENVPNGKYVGGRIGYAAGPFNVAASAGRQDIAASSRRFQIFNVAGSYDFGPARLVAQYNRERLPAPTPLRETRILLGAVVPTGTGEVHASVVRSDLADSPDDATLFALGYVHNLSKRTALYGTVARVSNKGAARFSVSGGTTQGGTGNASPGGPTAGGKSTGAEVGIRHFF